MKFNSELLRASVLSCHQLAVQFNVFIQAYPRIHTLTLIRGLKLLQNFRLIN